MSTISEIGPARRGLSRTPPFVHPGSTPGAANRTPRTDRHEGRSYPQSTEGHSMSDRTKTGIVRVMSAGVVVALLEALGAGMKWG